MARNNNAFSLGPMLEKEMLAAIRGDYADRFRNLGLSSKLLNKDYVLIASLPATPIEVA